MSPSIRQTILNAYVTWPKRGWNTLSWVHIADAIEAAETLEEAQASIRVLYRQVYDDSMSDPEFVVASETPPRLEELDDVNAARHYATPDAAGVVLGDIEYPLVRTTLIPERTVWCSSFATLKDIAVTLAAAEDETVGGRCRVKTPKQYRGARWFLEDVPVSKEDVLRHAVRRHKERATGHLLRAWLELRAAGATRLARKVDRAYGEVRKDLAINSGKRRQPHITHKEGDA